MNMFPAGNILVLCDFDGTICTVDMGNEILNRFTNGDWEKIDRAYVSDEIGSRMAYSQLSSCFVGKKAELMEFIDDRERLDPYFADFYLFCRENGFDLKIVSDGLNFYIDAVLKKYHLQDIEVFTNAGFFQGENDRLSIEFPFMNDQCKKCGTCKSGILNQCRSRYQEVIYVGNGNSDVCPSKDADLVFAKEILYERCLEIGRNCIHYESFRDVHEFMAVHIKDRLSATAKPVLVGRR